ncbi:hypothetical protein H9639_01770 [Arthrobacter sp. Sa2CUA1]|uniref:Uncharacterized protein n=1 Tax=Arthrobacter gallicola TaxID=2762225 RepID=A0ABR8UN99_9MICC|nr:hypothetical protein [Arthrobacter gallicola]MBD7994025.1 hypothetical protein [Arthrobacter gallicola]
MASTSTWMSAQPAAAARRAERPPAALRLMDLPVLLTVWMLCVLTDWSTPAKVLLNVVAVGLLCLKELAVHRYLLNSRPHQPVRPRVTLQRVPEPAFLD